MGLSEDYVFFQVDKDFEWSLSQEDRSACFSSEGSGHNMAAPSRCCLAEAKGHLCWQS